MTEMMRRSLRSRDREDRYPSFCKVVRSEKVVLVRITCQGCFLSSVVCRRSFSSGLQGVMRRSSFIIHRPVVAGRMVGMVEWRLIVVRLR